MAYHHGDLRRALLDATLRLTGERGAAAVTWREVARMAGVSQTAPYRHFADKEAILIAASEEGFELLHQALAAASSLREPKRRIVELGAAYVHFAVTHPSHLRLMFGQGSPAKAAAGSLQARARDAYQLVLAAVKAWQPKCQDPHAMTVQIWAICHGMAIITIERQLGLEADFAVTLARSALAALLRGRPVVLGHRHLLPK